MAKPNTCYQSLRDSTIQMGNVKASYFMLEKFIEVKCLIYYMLQIFWCKVSIYYVPPYIGTAKLTLLAAKKPWKMSGQEETTMRSSQTLSQKIWQSWLKNYYKPATKKNELSWREEQGKHAELSGGTNQALMVKYAYKTQVILWMYVESFPYIFTTWSFLSIVNFSNMNIAFYSDLPSFYQCFLASWMPGCRCCCCIF